MKRHSTGRTAGVACAGLLFAVNAVVCRRLFFTDYLSQMGAGDGPWIAMARFIMRYPGDLSWWPIWFTGMPLQNVYGPVLHGLVAALAAALGRSPAWTLHTVGALLYCLGPVALWWAVERLSGSRVWALATALLYSVTSPAAWLIPSIRADIGGPFHLRRLYDMVVYAEYPHVAVLTLMPVGLVVFDRIARDKRPSSVVAGAVLLACVAAASVTGSVGFALVAVAWLVALPAARWSGAVPRLGACAGLAYGLALPWLPPSTIRLIAFNSQWGTGRPTPFTARHILYFALIALAAGGVRWTMAHLRAPELLRFAILLMFLCGVIMLADLGAGMALLPQPYRFQLELEMGCAVAGGFLWLKTAGRLRPRAQAVLGGALVLALAATNAIHAGRYIRPIDIRTTVEYQVAQWLDGHMNGGRVFAPGSVSFWMNAFTDTPQLGGCCDQGVPSWEERVALYSVYSGQNMGVREGAVSLLWLQAFGVQAVEVTGRDGREFYKPYWNPHKFEGLLPVVWRDGGDVIYRVPQRSASLAHVMRESQVVPVAGRPKDGLDIGRLEKYVAALNDPQFPPAAFRWISHARARIVTDAARDDAISVQVSYDRGWQARSNGSAIPVTSDGLGLMVLHPHCAGTCAIDLEYTGGTEMRVARMGRILAALLCLTLVLLPHGGGSEKSIDERSDGGTLGQDQQGSEHQGH
jgi:hypothetical protein